MVHPLFIRHHITEHVFDHSVTHHHELASTTSSWELQARKAAASSRCRRAPVRLLRTGLLSMVRRVTATQPVLGKVLCCWDMGREWGGVPLGPAGCFGLETNPAARAIQWGRVQLTCLLCFFPNFLIVHLSFTLSFPYSVLCSKL